MAGDGNIFSICPRVLIQQRFNHAVVIRETFRQQVSKPFMQKSGKHGVFVLDFAQGPGSQAIDNARLFRFH